jgi:hypothetical protein
LPQYSVKVKDLVNNATSVVSVTAVSPREAKRAAVRRARILLGVDQLEVVGVVQYKPIA